MVPGAEGGRKGGASAATPGRGSALLEEGVVAAHWTAEQPPGLPRPELVCSCWAAAGTPWGTGPAQAGLRQQPARCMGTPEVGTLVAACWWQAAPAWLAFGCAEEMGVLAQQAWSTWGPG